MPVSHGASQYPTSLPLKESKRIATERFERGYLASLIAGTQGNVSAAARRAEVDRMYLAKLLRRYGLR
jgi:transcriptional regulator with GAF, ATPase, and Fis domain